jgi:predicted RNase H-like nuclease
MLHRVDVCPEDLGDIVADVKNRICESDVIVCFVKVPGERHASLEKLRRCLDLRGKTIVEMLNFGVGTNCDAADRIEDALEAGKNVLVIAPTNHCDDVRDRLCDRTKTQ